MDRSHADTPRSTSDDVAMAPDASTTAENGNTRNAATEILSYLDDRCRVHKDTIDICKSILQRKPLECISVQRNDLSNPIHDVDLVITVGGDGTLLRASHFLNSSIPVLGVNSDPTCPHEVDELTDEFDARRSTGYLCAATAANFEQILDATLDGSTQPSELSRISVKLNGLQLPTYALNDILVSHPCPASVSRFSFRKRSNTGESSHLINCRSSGLRVATSAGSTAAMLSAGGFVMPISSHELQYMIREPISPRDADKPLLHGFVKQDQHMLVVWYNEEGARASALAARPRAHADVPGAWLGPCVVAPATP
ncbi:hypothetical protein GUJ93_ZPchr0002g23793 [Zizania palustris]|uniref:NADH kinase n=1 Tax=Zizania palustris TaxID=103762 RepID=A0A8J5RYT3_ZIZPA|nr:hypothetical protein GUJ93_ZPchr0002g23793 [Zizania palustris]